MSVVDEIKARLDIVAYVQQFVPLKKAGRTYKACCPFHSERTPSFVVNPDSQTWRCFGACADGGDVISFAMKQHGWSFGEAMQNLGDQVGVDARPRTPDQRQRDVYLDRLRGLLETAALTYHTHLMEGQTEDVLATLDYVRHRRGLTDETIRRFRIGYAPPGWQNMLNELLHLGYDEADVIESGIAVKSDNGRVYDRFRNRLMIPICDERGRVVGFGARALDADDNPKYLNSPQTPVFDKSRLLFGLDQAKKAVRDSGVAVIVEGYLDVIQAHQAGFANVVAQMGTAMTETQIKALVPRYTQKIVLALDSDAAGQNATRRSLETARQALEADYAGRMAVDIRVLQIPDAKDPDDLIRESPERWQALVDAAVPVADFVIMMETDGLTPNATVQEREAVARRLLPILLASENNLYTQDNLQKLALKLRIAERDLLTWSQERRAHESRTPRRPAPQEEPPAIDYDALEPPSYEDEEPAAAPQLEIQPDTVESLEADCLRALLRYPDLFYQANRKFRELAAGNDLLLDGLLCELGPADFARSEYRVMMQVFVAALHQDEMEIGDYLYTRLDPVLLRQLEHLLADDAELVRGRLRQRFAYDFTDVWKRQTPVSNVADGLLGKTLRLRLRRVKRQVDELAFLQKDAETGSDDTAVMDLGMRIIHTTLARKLLEDEEKRLSTITII